MQDINGNNEIRNFRLKESMGYSPFYYANRLLKREVSRIGKILYIKDGELQYSLLDMICDRKKREEIFNHFDSIYQETDEENEIFRMMTRRRKNRCENLGGNSTTK